MNHINNTAGGQQGGLSPAKQALLAKWLRDAPRASGDRLNGSIPRRADRGAAGLSLEQQRFWFFHQLEPTSPLYTMPIGARLRGTLQPEALQHALNAVVARHEVLRTRFVGEEPALVTDPLRALPLTQIDLRHLPAAERESEARRLLTAEARRPFDLSQDLVMRATLVRLEEDEWAFLVLMHHIASDDWSWRVLCNEVAEAYDAFLAGRELQLPELPIQYADFAAWQGQWSRGPMLEDLLSWWRNRLAGAPHVIGLPMDHPRPPSQTFRGGCEWLELSHTLSEQIHALSQRAGATPFMILLAAFQTLLHRYSGQDDFLVGSPVAGRTRASVERSIGLFINMLVLRADLGGDPTFHDLLRSVQSNVLEALARQELPFEKLVQELEPERSPSHPPLVQVMFALQDELSENLRLPGVMVSPFQIDTGTAKFDLTLTIVQSAANRDFNCCAEYNTDLFEPSTIERMLRHFERLLDAILLNPEKRVSELPILPQEERQQVLIEWNRTAVDYPVDKCVHEIFAAQAAEGPEAVALACGGSQLTRGELNRRANQLAHHLRRLGVGPERLVGVAMDRSLDMVVALLGILKAGGAYLPLDPSYPAERLRFMLKDSGASLLITGRSESSSAVFQGVRSICLDVDWPRIGEERDDDPKAGTTPDNLAYVIYTSGSTGQPKGTQIVHRSLLNFLHSMRREPVLTRDDTLLSVTSISFDIAALEIFLPLSTGARLVIADADTVFDVARLARLIAECQATVMQATPTLWRVLVDSGWAGDGRLKILCGGEALSRELADQLLDRSAEVWNLYGPTETTIWSTVGKVGRDGQPISIGRPIANTQVYLLDRYLHPVPIGSPGVLYIGGAGLARGYLNRPELTAERFIRNPFDEDGSSRLYNTGDIARYLPDGRIECLGRSDSQVKLRGYRIDLGEVEATLRRHPGVRETVVSLRENASAQKHLTAYLIPANGAPPSSQELQSFLKGRLPDYMIPEAFVVLDEFPLTPNGKVNRNGLPAPGPGSPAAKENFVPPRTPIEEKLAGIWREVMKRDQVGREDDFFDLGGHSLLAMRMVSRVRKAFSTGLTIRDIFDTPTIAGLAAILARTNGHSANGSSSRKETILAPIESL
jgi:amino acid adenylation domain-containing protein